MFSSERVGKAVVAYQATAMRQNGWYGSIGRTTGQACTGNPDLDHKKRLNEEQPGGEIFA
jgi:hypothetical protein